MANNQQPKKKEQERRVAKKKLSSAAKKTRSGEIGEGAWEDCPREDEAHDSSCSQARLRPPQNENSDHSAPQRWLAAAHVVFRDIVETARAELSTSVMSHLSNRRRSSPQQLMFVLLHRCKPGFSDGYEAQIDSGYSNPIHTRSQYGLCHVDQQHEPGS